MVFEMKKVLILGGYGNFGKRIAIALAKANVSIIIAGRNKNKAEILASQIKQQFRNSAVEIAIFDAKKDLNPQLEQLVPSIVINTCGPFQNANYAMTEICIAHKIHYIDLADGRDFVNGITILDSAAKKNNVLVVSGASTVPGLSSAVLEYYKNEFTEIDSLSFGINPGQKTPRGLATTKSILSYLGKPLKPFAGNNKKIYGWQNLYRQEYPEVGKRWMANCDIPDLDLLPPYYGIKSIRFSAGMESSFIHLSMWLLSWLIRFGLPINLPAHANLLLRLSHYFDWLGTTDGGMHMIIKGKDRFGNSKEIKWFIIATQGDGPQIPCIPAIVLTKKLLANQIMDRGAMPCVGMVTLREYENELQGFSVRQYFI